VTCELCTAGHPRAYGKHEWFIRGKGWTVLGPCTDPDQDPVNSQAQSEAQRVRMAAIRERMASLTEKPKPRPAFTERSAPREPGEDDGDE
jgi:hypothetical protein